MRIETVPARSLFALRTRVPAAPVPTGNRTVVLKLPAPTPAAAAYHSSTVPATLARRGTGTPSNVSSFQASKRLVPQVLPPPEHAGVPQLPPVKSGVAEGPQLLAPTSHREPPLDSPPPALPERRSLYAHQSSHLWLLGVLERGPEAGTWSLRYARPEDSDPHGGVLPLVAPQPILGYRAGQVLRVEGHVVKDALSASYQVERIEAIPQH